MTMIEPTAEQAQAIDAIELWWRSARMIVDGLIPHDHRAGEFLLDGGAGTGKTTTAGIAIDRLGLKRVVFGAYTAKAARVMGWKGMHGAATLHRLLYTPTFDKDGRATGWRRRNDSPIKDADLVVIDEASMAPDMIVEDLRSYSKPVLVLGDIDGQLPPPKGTGAFIGRSPDFRLTELHRTAEESPIANLAWRIRNGASLRPGGSPEAFVAPLRAEAWVDILDRSNQVICGKHKTRFAVTRRARERFGFAGPLPRPGEPLVCRRNNYGQGLVNGDAAVMWRMVENDITKPTFSADLYVDGELRPGIEINRDIFASHTDTSIKLDEWRQFKRSAADFDWAYAITCHTAQGQEFPCVVVIDDQFARWDRDLRRRWLYTACTRASEKLLVLQTG